MPDSLSDAALIVHAGTACFMAGLIWFVQIVHYPLMRLVPPGEFSAYERAHQSRVTRIVAPVMLIESLATAMILMPPEGGVTGDPMRWAAAVLLVVNHAATFGILVPLHARLARGHDDALVACLVRMNWIRTFAWTARAVIGLALLR